MQTAPSSPTLSALGVHPLVVDGERFSKMFLPLDNAHSRARPSA